MPRGLTAQVKAELATNDFTMAHLVRMKFSYSTFRYTDYVSDLQSSGGNYTAIGHFLDIGSPQETQELRVGTINVTLSGVERSFISLFLNNDWINREVSVDRALISSSGTIIANPFTIFEGYMSQFQVSESGDKSDITVAVSSHWADFDKKAGRNTNNNSQQYFFDLDKGFEYASSIVKDLKWGRG